MKLCSINKCYSTGVTRHRFPNPVKYPDRFQQWLHRTNNARLQRIDPMKIYSHSVCGLHFVASDFNTNKKLLNSAVPTLRISYEKEYSNSADVINVQESKTLENTELSTINDNHIFYSDSQISNIRTNFKISESNSVARKKTMSPTSRKNYMLLTKFKRSSQKNKIKAASYRQRLKLFAKFEMKLESNVLGKDAINFCLGQLKKRNIKPKGRRYSTEEKILALAFYKQSGRAYSKLREFFALPTRQTMMAMLNKVPLNAGFNKFIFDNLKEAASQIKHNRDKICSLIFDEMSIMPHIDYDKATDKFYGFQDFGHNQNLEIADHVLVFYLRGLFKKWQQPIYFTFSSSATKSSDIVAILKFLIKEVQNCGLNIITTICDQGQPNQAAINFLVNESNKINVENKQQTKRKIILDNQDIIPLFDAPHLIKGIRNNLVTKNLVWEVNGEVLVAKWDHVVEAYSNDATCGELRALHKITDQHVIPEKIKKNESVIRCSGFESLYGFNDFAVG